MAINGYDKKIGKHQDWGGDNSTGGLPVLGSRVQEFIKEQLENRIGVLYYDSANNRYIAFADEENRDAYIETGDPSLVLGTFDAPFNYSAEITLTTPTYNAVFLGSIGNYIDFTFDIKNKAGASTGENVYVTYTIMHNATKRVVTETRRYGESVHFNVDQYLKEGVNTIIVGISGQNTLAATTTAITYQVVDLQIKDELDISKVYNLASGSTEMEIIWSVKGYGTKVVEWYIDGVLQPFDRVVDEVVAIEGGSPKYITLSALGNGRHSLQMRAYTTINGENFYTDTLYRDFIVYDGATTTPTIGVALTIPKDFGVVASGSSLVIYDIIQYVPYTFKFATFSPLGEASMNVDVFIGDEKKGSVASKNGVVNEFLFVSNKTGATTLRLVSENATLSIPVNVAVTNMNLREITEGLMFDFNANGRNNNASDKDQWSYGEYTATFEGFNWNSTSGWVNNRLRISDGATFGVNFAPLSGSPVALGRTVEIEFSTTNVTNDDAVICDLRQNGVGILITATKVLLHSEEGAEIVNEFKENENVRFAFVMNRVSGVTNKGLAFIYTNGIVARCINYSITDDFASSANIQFSGSSQAQVLLKAIRVYNQALSSDDILNNFTLYRDNVADMMDVYDRNNVYEEGTVTFSPDKMVNRLPVMIVTGDIPTLENTNDKDTQIIVDIEYTNMQDPSKNFTMTQAAMRPQGTSSMGYPKKNFRIYTQKVDGTILKDSQGNVVANKLYAFTDGAQPVDCWCLKADYAESSGTHNTGIARMWHDILMNTQLDGEYVLRTNAQKAAILSNYQYDVRTTIDGFPILLFYRRTATSDLIFIGKYNFNNDKSTESVFGFEGIPNFNNSRMQCWEILNNGNAIALFTNISDFYKTITVGNETQEGWKFAFESRYPDTKTPITTDLYNFATWMNGVSQSAFATEKWAHMDVYKMAAYYCYLMRFAGADQFVKNAMLTSEDGEHFYFILYDNDTINGLINTGRLAISPSDNRQTKDASGEYVFAGHDSLLWNRLEADSEFMAIVSAIDDAMFSAGLSYENAIHFFDELQAEKWVERVYNQDAQYKYITPYVESGTNNLFMLQGDRAIHRKWFLAKRFALYDSLLVSGAYKSQSMEFKCINNTQAGQTFTVTSGNNMNYGYGINDVPREVGISLDVNESYDFVTKETVNLGDPIRLYAAPNIKGLDFSQMTARLATMDITKVYTESLGTQLTSLIIGNASATNNELTTISGLNKANKLEVLDVQGCKGLTSLDLSNQPYFKTLKAKGSSVASVIFAKGAAVERIELPSLVKTLTLSQLPYLDGANVEIDGGWGNITSINVTECPNVSNDFSLVWNWFNAVTPSNCSLVMDNVAWEGMTAQQLISLKQLGVLNVRGYAKLSSITLEEYELLKSEFGNSIFDQNQSFFIAAPSTIFIQGNSYVLDGESTQYSSIVINDVGTTGTIKYSISSGANQYVSIDENTGLLTTIERGTLYRVTVRATYTVGSNFVYDEISVSVQQPVYPTNATINGANEMGGDTETYTWSTTTQNVTGRFYAEWSLSGEAYDGGYVTIESQDNEKAVLKLLNYPSLVLSATLTLTLKKVVNDAVIVTSTKSVGVSNPNLAITKASNPAIMSVMYSKGLAANEEYMTKAECAAVTESQLQPGTSYSTSIFYSNRNSINSFDEFRHFTGLSSVPVSCFEECYNLSSIIIPNSVTSLGNKSFRGCQKLTNIVIPESVSSIGNQCFDTCSIIERIDIPGNVQVLSQNCFSNCQKLSYINIPYGVTTINNYCFNNCKSLTSIVIPDSVTSLGTYCFQGCNLLNNIVLSNGLTELPNYCFNNCSSLELIDIPQNIKKIGNNCFESCTSLASITIPETVTSLGTYCFNKCTGLISAYIYPNIYSLPNGVFSGCSSLTTVELPSTMHTFNQYCFSSCTSLEIAPINEKIRIIGDQCFANCLSLTRVNIHSEVSSIGSGIFNGCEDLDINVDSNNGYFSSVDGVLFNKNGTQLKEFRKSKKIQNYQIPSGVTTLNNYCFHGCKALTSITIPDTVTSLGEYCFYNCSSLESIELPNSITTMGTRCFANCTNITTFNVPSGVTALISYCFSGCTALKSITVHDAIKSFGDYCFENCSSLTSITIPASVTGGFYSGVFKGCKSLKTIYCLVNEAPFTSGGPFGSSTSNYTGRNTYNTGENMLYVPQGATGYDTGQWLDPLQNATKCGFTLSATL